MRMAACVVRERAVYSGNRRGRQTRAGEARARNGAAVSVRPGVAEVIGGAFVARPVHSRVTLTHVLSRALAGNSAVRRGQVPRWEPHRFWKCASNDDETAQGVDVQHVAGAGVGVPHEGY